MSDSFIKIKKRFLWVAITLALVFGVFSGLAIAGILLIIFKLAAVNIGWWVYPVAGVVAGLIVAAISFLFLRPNDKKVAKKIDTDYALNEKTQTMTEFEGKCGEVVELQRESTLAALESLKPQKAKVSTVLKCSVLPILGVALIAAGLAVPRREKAEVLPQPEDSYELSAIQAAALKNLIEDVRSSSLGADIKTTTITILEGLLSGLDEEQTTATMGVAVRSAAGLIDEAVKGVNTYINFRATLKTSDVLIVRNLGKILLTASKSYKADGRKITSMEMVADREKKSEESIRTIFEDYCADVEATVEKKDKTSEIVSLLNSYGLEYKLRIANAVEDIDSYENDELYSGMLGLASFMTDMDGKGYSATNLIEQLSVQCDDFVYDMTSEMCVQSYRRMMAEYIRNRLSTIFNVTLSDPFDESDSESEDDGTTSDDESSSNGGGYAQGGIGSPSDDLIFYYGDSEIEMGYVKYSEVLNLYNSIKEEYLSSGTFSEELIVFINNYFSKLYS
jgi:membrane protein implicated in regulation of membrane protease activity